MKKIKKTAVLGAGVMGATIAAHLANAHIQVLLLDMAPIELTEAEKSTGKTLEDKRVRNRIVTAGYDGLKKLKPAPYYLQENATYIEVGNFDDDLEKLKECDWVIEAVVEDMDVKKRLIVEKIVPNLKDGSILSTNTSGLSVNELSKCLPENLRKTFLATHFFNPPRHMHLLEIVSSDDTAPEVTQLIAEFASKRLGKGVVYGKDTPNFVANRIGVYAVCNCLHNMVEMDMTVEEVDAVAGPATGRPKSAVFRSADLVGIDTLQRVASNSYELLINDPQRDSYCLPGFVGEMVAKGLLGNKTKQGFFKEVRSENAVTSFFYDYKSGEYTASRKSTFTSVEAVKTIEDPAKRIMMVINGDDKGALFAWRNLRDILLYAFNLIPEIADNIVNIDNAMKWGFNWEIGPFEMLDSIGVKNFVARAEKDGAVVPEGLKSIERFYKDEGGTNSYFRLLDNTYREVPKPVGQISLSILKKNGGIVEQNSDASLLDLGEGVFCLEFHTKMNALGSGIGAMIQSSIRRAEEEGLGLVIANEGSVFSAGANLSDMSKAIAEGKYAAIETMIRNIQKIMMEMKYSTVPVIAAPHSMALGGGCEICLHADAMNPHAETYMGLVEIGVGLLPAGGGTKEMAVRAIKQADKYDVDITPLIVKNFMHIAMAKVSNSAAELYDMGFMQNGDTITMNIKRRINDAKLKAIALAINYLPGRQMTELKAPGRSIAATIKAQLWNMRMGGYISEYDEFLGCTIADVISGGDVPGGTLISEEYLLDLELEAFLGLCGQKKTQERIHHMLRTGKSLRN